MDNDTIKKVAKVNNLEPAAIKAVVSVESGGNGFISDGKPKILFEGHIFWNQLIKVGIDPQKLLNNNSDYKDIIYQKWTKIYYSEDQYMRLEKAKKINLSLPGLTRQSRIICIKSNWKNMSP